MNFSMNKLIVILLLMNLMSSALAAEPTSPTSPTPPVPAASGAGEEVDLSKITEKYWAEGKETELGVVQNRKYTTAKKLEIGLIFGTISSDPFLNVHSLGGSVGYHFSPYTSVHFTSWKTFVGPSDALKTFVSQTGSTVDTNSPLAYYGTEVKQNFLYGKASLFGSMIIYVDLFVLAGVGITKTESGNYFTPTLGLGQKIYLNERMSLNLDYRIMRYNETILSKNPALLGNPVGTRANTTDAVSLGVSFFLF